MSHTSQLAICCSGYFPFISCFDTSLNEHTRIPTTSTSDWKHDILVSQSPINCRVASVMAPPSDPSRRLVAVSGRSEPHAVQVFDMDTQRRVSSIADHEKNVNGLACIPSQDALGVNPRIVSGSSGRILISDVLNGEVRGQFRSDRRGGGRPSSPHYIYRIIYACGRIFVGSKGGIGVYSDLDRIKHNDSDCGTLEMTTSQAGSIYGLSADVIENLLVSAGEDRVQLAQISDARHLVMHFSIPQRAYSCCFSGKKHLVAVGMAQGKVGVYDVRSVRRAIGETFSVSRGSIHDILQVSENDDRFVSGSEDGFLSMWSSSGKILRKKKLDNCVYGVSVFGERLFEDRAVQSERIDFCFSLGDISRASFSILIRGSVVDVRICCWKWCVVDV